MEQNLYDIIIHEDHEDKAFSKITIHSFKSSSHESAREFGESISEVLGFSKPAIEVEFRKAIRQ